MVVTAEVLIKLTAEIAAKATAEAAAELMRTELVQTKLV